MNKLWTPSETDNLIAVLNARPEGTLEERCRAIAGLNGRSGNALSSKAREIGWEPSDALGEPTLEVKREILHGEIRKLQNELEREKERTAAIEKAIAESITALPALEIPKRKPLPRKARDTHTAMLLVGDCQAGEAFTESDISGLGSAYNFDVFGERAQLLTSRTIQLTDIYREYAPVDNLKILFLGDIVEGEEIYRGQRSYIDRPIFDQTFGGSEVLSRMVSELSGHFKEITCYCVWGNHGRLGKDFREDQNFDTLCYKFMQTRLAPFKGIKFFVSKSYVMAFKLPELPEYIWCMWHGDNVQRHLAFPYYGLDRAAAEYIQLTNLPINYFIVGHHHRYAKLERAHGDIIVNSSWVGTSPYSATKIRTGGVPSQTFMVLHPNKGIAATWKIWLGEPFKLNPDDRGVMTPYGGK